MSKLVLFNFLAFMLLAISCSTAPDFPDEPVIEFISISKTLYEQALPPDATDTILFVLSFTDGNGDIGDENNEMDIEIIDSRTMGEFDTPSLPMLPLQGSGNGVEGEISVRNVFGQEEFCCLPPSGACRPSTVLPVDSLRLLIRIRDREGNWSNQVSSPAIFITCN